jgi:hypothetical protein
MSHKQGSATNAVMTGTVEVAARAREVPRRNLSLTRAHRN